jgi:hypothetical protein
MPGVTDAQDPLAMIRALPQIANGSGTTLAVFENLHRFLGATEIVQALARQIQAGKNSRCFVVVLAPAVQIPPELDKLFTVIDHELPGHAQLEEIARGIATQDGELPAGDDLARVIEAAAGLTASEAENAFSLALVRHGTLEPETLWELKSQQLKKSGLVALHRGTESFDQLGGLENLKAFCLRAMRRQSDAKAGDGPVASCSFLLPAAASPSSRRPSATRPAGPRSYSMSERCWEASSDSRKATSVRP